MLGVQGSQGLSGTLRPSVFLAAVFSGKPEAVPDTWSPEGTWGSLCVAMLHNHSRAGALRFPWIFPL